jgi:hypothetical protein
MYAKEMTTRSVSAHLYDIEASHSIISRITDAIYSSLLDKIYLKNLLYNSCFIKSSLYILTDSLISKNFIS